MYGFVYIRTVVVFPRGIFFVGLITVVISVILMGFIRLPQDSELKKEIMSAYHRGDLEETGFEEELLDREREPEAGSRT